MVEKMTPELIEELQEAFRLWDMNGDGTITKDEINHIFKALELETTSEQLDKMMNEADINGSGAIEFSEFLVLMSKKYERRDTAAEMRKMFIAFDLDGSGKISFHEMKEVMGRMGQVLTSKEVEEMIEVADINGDGEVDYEEFLTIMQKVS